VLLVVALLVLGLAGWAAWALGDPTRRVLAEGESEVPTVVVAKGTIKLTVRMAGDLRASRQAALTAPAVGGALRVLSVLDTGATVEQGATLMEFDPADQIFALEQAESELDEAGQELIKRRADIAAQTAQEKVGLLTAQFDVRRAELDAQVGPELIGANEHKIRQVSLDEARKRLTQVEQDVASRAVTSKASLQVLQERLNRSSMSAERARQNMETLVVKAPMAGVVAVRDNQDASGGFFFSGMSLPAYRVGDTVTSGRPVIDVFDISSMEVRTRVNEQERANVAPGQPAAVTSAAVPGVTQRAVVTAVSGFGRPDQMAGPQRQFDVTLELKEPDPRLRPGTTVTVVVEGPTVENVLVLPRQALFERDGKPVVHVKTAGGGRFEVVEVKVLHRSESQVAIEGVAEGTTIALVDPSAASPAPGAPSSPAGVIK
jgi:multidrug resistance efflux pump